jgi:hypothetical protein
MIILNTLMILIIIANLFGIYMGIRDVMKTRAQIKQIQEIRDNLAKINHEIEMRLLQDDDRRREYQVARDTILQRHNIG